MSEGIVGPAPIWCEGCGVRMAVHEGNKPRERRRFLCMICYGAEEKPVGYSGTCIEGRQEEWELQRGPERLSRAEKSLSTLRSRLSRMEGAMERIRDLCDCGKSAADHPPGPPCPPMPAFSMAIPHWVRAYYRSVKQIAREALSAGEVVCPNCATLTARCEGLTKELADLRVLIAELHEEWDSRSLPVEMRPRQLWERVDALRPEALAPRGEKVNEPQVVPGAQQTGPPSESRGEPEGPTEPAGESGVPLSTGTTPPPAEPKSEGEGFPADTPPKGMEFVSRGPIGADFLCCYRDMKNAHWGKFWNNRKDSTPKVEDNRDLAFARPIPKEQRAEGGGERRTLSQPEAIAGAIKRGTVYGVPLKERPPEGAERGDKSVADFWGAAKFLFERGREYREEMKKFPVGSHTHFVLDVRWTECECAAFALQELITKETQAKGRAWVYMTGEEAANLTLGLPSNFIAPSKPPAEGVAVELLRECHRLLWAMVDPAFPGSSGLTIGEWNGQAERIVPRIDTFLRGKGA